MPGILDDLPPKSDFDRAREKAGDLAAPQMTRGPDGLPAMSQQIVLQAPPATEEHLVCMAGCRHYCEVLADSDDVTTGGPMQELRRYCVRLQAGSELMEIGEAAILGCSFFSPRWWSPKAWRTWRKSQRRLTEYRDALAARDAEGAGGEDDYGTDD